MSWSNQESVSPHLLCPSIISSPFPLPSRLAYLSLAFLFSARFGSGSAGLKHHSPPPLSPSLSTKTMQVSLVPAVLLLSVFLSAWLIRRSSPFFSFLHLVFFLSVSVCAPSTSLSLSEPVGSQTERVSRGLERGIISLLLPPHTPSHLLSITVFIPPPPLHLLLLHNHHTNLFPLFSLTTDRKSVV